MGLQPYPDCALRFGLTSHGAGLTGHKRLIVVHRPDFSGRYTWLPQPRPGDVTVVFDSIAGVDLADRQPILFDQLENWKERSAAKYRLNKLLGMIAEHPAVTAFERSGFRLIDFAEPRLRQEVTRLTMGWKLASAGVGARELVCDPALPPALEMGVRAGLRLTQGTRAYSLPPALPGSRSRRAVARQLMRVTTMVSRTERVRVAAVAAGKLALALESLTDAELRRVKLGLMPFPGLDHGNGLLLALRRRLPLLRTYGPARVGVGASVDLPETLELDGDAALDRTLTALVAQALGSAAPELDQAVRAVSVLNGARSLRALLLPSATYSASRLLIQWAHERGVRVGAFQHGIYSSREPFGGDPGVDVIFGWGEDTSEQVACWQRPWPAVHPVGVPGVHTPAPAARKAAAPTVPRHVLIATSGIDDYPTSPVMYREAFVDTLAPGIKRLTMAGAKVELRPHPGEDPERYTQLLRARGLDVGIAPAGPFATVAKRMDILISSTSSVAFEAAALGLPVLLWLGPAPRWVRREHLVPPWTDSLPGMFDTAESLQRLIDALIERPAAGLHVAHELGRHLARYAEPFTAAAFASGLRQLGECETDRV